MTKTAILIFSLAALGLAAKAYEAWATVTIKATKESYDHAKSLCAKYAPKGFGDMIVQVQGIQGRTYSVECNDLR